jgi:predicted nucleic acid-binding protein
VTGTTDSELFLVDSSGWLEYVTADTKAEFFRPYFQPKVRLVVPSIVVYEVRKILLLRHTSLVADWFVSEVVRHGIVDLDHFIALEAAALSVRYQLHMADAVIYASALQHRAQLLTSDTHFANLPGVKVV